MTKRKQLNIRVPQSYINRIDEMRDELSQSELIMRLIDEEWARRNVMYAQKIYDFANDGGCSGGDMHQFFEEVLDEPSPSGYEIIPADVGIGFMQVCLTSIHANSPSAEEWCARIAEKHNIEFIRHDR